MKTLGEQRADHRVHDRERHPAAEPLHGAAGHDHDHRRRCRAHDTAGDESRACEDESRAQPKPAHDGGAGGASDDRRDGVRDRRPRIEREAADVRDDGRQHGGGDERTEGGGEDREEDDRRRDPHGPI
jgi:hypothetical protein